MQPLVRARYAVGRLVHPARERARAREFDAMQETGAELRDRLQSELGPAYLVTYHRG